MVDFANNHKDFRLPVADPKMGRVRLPYKYFYIHLTA